MVLARWLLGSGAKCQAAPPDKAATASESCVFRTPASTCAARFSRSILRMRFIRVVETIAPFSNATHPPANPVPDPRGTICTPAFASALITSTTCAVFVGNATSDGRALAMVKASDSYTNSSAGSDRMLPCGRMCLSSASNWASGIEVSAKTETHHLQPMVSGGADIRVCLESVSGGHSCPPEPIRQAYREPIRIRPAAQDGPALAVRRLIGVEFVQTRMSAAPNPAGINSYASPEIHARPCQ